MVDKHHALAREEIIEALTAHTGVTTADGATPANNTLKDSNLIGKNDFISGKTILIGAGVDASYEDKLATTFAPLTGEITVSAGFSAQIKQGTTYRVLNVSSGGVVSVLLAAIKAKTDNLPTTPADEVTVNAVGVVATGIKTQTDKLAGATPVSGSTTAAWQTAEADVVSFGADNVKNKVHSLVLSIHNLVGTTITARLYMQVKGTERKVYEQLFDATADPLGLWIVNGTVGIHEVVRATLQSNNAADNNKAVDYDYMIEAM